MRIYSSVKMSQNGRLPSCKAYVFDFDGTLVDSADLWKRADDVFFLRHGIRRPDNFGELTAGKTFKEVAQMVLDMFSLPDMTVDSILQEWTNTYDNMFANGVDFVAGAGQFLRQAKSDGIKTAIATSTSGALVETFFQRFPQERACIDVIVCTKEVGKKKPDPLVYLEALRRISTDAKDAVIFEDTVTGLTGARKTSAHVVCICTDRIDYATKQSLSDIIVPTFAELVMDH